MSALGNMRARAAVLFALMAFSASSRAFGQELIERPFRARFDARGAVIRVDAHDLVDADLTRRLQSGLPQTLVTRVYALPGEDDTPIAVTVRACRITYDPWRMSYRIAQATAHGDRAHTVAELRDVIRECFDINDLRVGGAAEYEAARGRAIRFAAIIELNPISPDMVGRIQRWLAQPSGARGHEAFFGSFVSLFVSPRIGTAARIVRLRASEWVRCP